MEQFPYFATKVSVSTSFRFSKLLLQWLTSTTFMSTISVIKKKVMMFANHINGEEFRIIHHVNNS